MSDKALHINGLEKRYPTGVEALKGVSIDIEPGEFYGLLGPNGAGKSTLIHCSTGLAQPTGGEIRIFGHDAISDYAESIRLNPNDFAPAASQPLDDTNPTIERVTPSASSARR